jgi:hypothetical protein
MLTASDMRITVGEDAEVVVETAAVIVCGALGLDTSGESIP